MKQTFRSVKNCGQYCNPILAASVSSGVMPIGALIGVVVGGEEGVLLGIGTGVFVEGKTGVSVAGGIGVLDGV